MITQISYTSSFFMTICTKYANYTSDSYSCSLQSMIERAKAIFSNETAFVSDMVNQIIICDAETGEICAECTPDPDDAIPFNNINYELKEFFNLN